jgi:predicted O-methyltransferase YrrM
MTEQRIFSDNLADAMRVSDMLRRNPDAEWRAGSAEPWIARLLQQLVIAHGARDVVEIGGFEGYTSEFLLRALATSKIPKATLTVCEIDEERAHAIGERLTRVGKECAPNVVASVVLGNSLAWLPGVPNESFDFVWLDGNHTKPHVDEEITLLLPRLRPGGVIYGHDAFGTCDLQAVFRKHGGYALDLPRLGLAGGLGIIQRPR